MKINSIFRFVAMPLIAAAFLLSGCSHSSSPPGSSYDLTWKVPGLTSIYIETYSHGTLAIGQQGSNDASYIVSSDEAFDGEPNTITLTNTRPPANQIHFAFEANGDYSILDSSAGQVPGNWLKFPTSGGSPITQTIDAIYPPDGISVFDSIHVHKLFTRTYVDVEPFEDTTKIVYGAFKVHEVETVHDTIFQHPSVVTDTIFNTDYWIAPNLGWIVKDSSYDGTNWTRQILDGSTVH